MIGYAPGHVKERHQISMVQRGTIAALACLACVRIADKL
jgi:hypothetical protein